MAEYFVRLVEVGDSLSSALRGGDVDKASEEINRWVSAGCELVSVSATGNGMNNSSRLFITFRRG